MNWSYWLLKLVWLESHAGQRSFDETLDAIRLLHFLSACSLVSFPFLLVSSLLTFWVGDEVSALVSDPHVIGVTCRSAIFWWDYRLNPTPSFPSLISSPPSLLPCFPQTLSPSFLAATSPSLLFSGSLPPLPHPFLTFCLFARLHPSLAVPSTLPPSPSVRVRAQGSDYSLAHVQGPWIVLSTGSESPAWLGFSNELWERRGVKKPHSLLPILPPTLPWLKQIN